MRHRCARRARLCLVQPCLVVQERSCAVHASMCAGACVTLCTCASRHLCMCYGAFDLSVALSLSALWRLLLVLLFLSLPLFLPLLPYLRGRRWQAYLRRKVLRMQYLGQMARMRRFAASVTPRGHMSLSATSSVNGRAFQSGMVTSHMDWQQSAGEALNL